MIGIGAVARETPDATAMVTLGATISFGELDRRQRLLAGALQAGGLGRGDRIAVICKNRPESLEVTAGALRAGIVPVPVNPLLTDSEVAYLLEDSGARWLLTDRPAEPEPGVERVITFGDAYERCLHEASPADVADVSLGRPMHYTSGTTGQPKGVWIRPQRPATAADAAADFISLWNLNAEDIHLVCSPLAHSAPHRFSLRTLEAGGTVVLLQKFDAEESLATIDLMSITTTFMVPTHLERIMALRQKLARYDLSSVRLLAHAGSPIRNTTKREVIDLLPRGTVWEFYGSTEGVATRISSDEWSRKPGSVGTARAGTHLSVRGETGEELAAGEVGEVWISDPSAGRFEYWGDPQKTQAAWSGSWFTVGDLGFLDEDGYLFLTGRKHDMIITGGINVYPQEIEAVLQSHPAVRDAMVQGEPHPEWGQEVVAKVVGAPGQPLDPELLRKWARERLAGFKCPRRIEIVASLPRTATGKLQRSRTPPPSREPEGPEV
ncbi:MAG: long-chain acyl-CoA synthetase [Actinomycetota bacterium]|jgi:acyl-CoA synthetase (AMP-forming)/AMP-acid ligase II|nr:long-chain acyl-CoA synthetase [Actinomycetota bacterium]